MRAYGQCAHVVDFRTDAEASRGAVNRWSDDETRGKIDQLVPRGAVNPFTRFLGATAAYLQAPWKLEFDRERTRPAQFHTNDGRTLDVPTMQLVARSGIGLVDTDDVTAVELPYLGDQLSLLVVAPKVDQFARYEQALAPSVLQDLADGMQDRPVDLRLPLFQFTSDFSLNESLASMGAPNLFSDANLSGVTADEQLSLSEAVYQAFFGVNEDGTDPPGTTATVQSPDSPPVASTRQVAIDRPFVFAVRDRDTGLVLFLGRVTNPA
jgi:serpin B